MLTLLIGNLGVLLDEPWLYRASVNTTPAEIGADPIKIVSNLGGKTRRNPGSTLQMLSPEKIGMRN